MIVQLPVSIPQLPTPSPQPPATDQALIALWLHGRPAKTQRAYMADAERLAAFAQKPLPTLTLADVQAFADNLTHLAPASQARTLSAVKSLLSFGHRIGYLLVNVGAALRLPKGKNTLAERIVAEEDIQRMLALESNVRNRALLRLLYGGGLRVSEACALCWRDLQPRGEAGQVNVYGKGGTTRVVLLSAATWREVSGLRGDGGPDGVVFRSRKCGALDASQAWRIVKSAAKRASLPDGFSPHWLRHAHASHALDRGAPISLVQATLGHADVSTTGKYLHARPGDSSARYLGV